MPKLAGLSEILELLIIFATVLFPGGEGCPSATIVRLWTKSVTAVAIISPCLALIEMAQQFKYIDICVKNLYLHWKKAKNKTILPVSDFADILYTRAPSTPHF